MDFFQKINGKKLTIKLKNRRQLSILRESFFNKQEDICNLNEISTNPVLYKNLPKGLFIWGICLLAFTLISFVAWLVAGTGDDNNGISLLLVGGIISAVCLGEAYRQYLSVYLYKSVNDGRTLFYIDSSRPSKKSIDLFMKELEKKITDINYNPDYSAQEMSEIYMKHLEYLFTEKVLSKEAYEESVLNINKKYSAENVRDMIRPVG